MLSVRRLFTDRRCVRFVIGHTYCSGVETKRVPLNPEPFNVEALAGGDETLGKKLKMLLMEIELLKDECGKVPANLNEQKWKELLELKSYSQRKKQLAFWFINEKKRENDKVKKKQKQALRLLNSTTEEVSNDHIRYGIGGSTLFLRIYDKAIDQQSNSRLVQAMMFGQNLVIDCSYDQHMSLKEASNCAKQLVYVFSENRLHKSPFNLHFCNASPQSRVISKFHQMIPTLYEDWFPLNITEKHYLDKFPKEKLVYLTPHCRNELLTYSHDDIYIIGAMVDKSNQEPLSLGKAKSLGLRMASLPLDRFLQWDSGSKSLTLNQVLRIMLDMQVMNDWEKALVHVPSRKIREDRY